MKKFLFRFSLTAKKIYTYDAEPLAQEVRTLSLAYRQGVAWFLVMR